MVFNGRLMVVEVPATIYPFKDLKMGDSDPRWQCSWGNVDAKPRKTMKFGGAT